jgi:hypothetical protein
MNTSASGVRSSDQISFDQFAQQLNSVFDRLAREGKGVLVERRGRVFRLTPLAADEHGLPLRPDAGRVRNALRAATGAYRGVNRESWIEDIRAEREQEGRGPSR